MYMFHVITSRCSPFSFHLPISYHFRLTVFLLTPPYRSSISLYSILGPLASVLFILCPPILLKFSFLFSFIIPFSAVYTPDTKRFLLVARAPVAILYVTPLRLHIYFNGSYRGRGIFVVNSMSVYSHLFHFSPSYPYFSFVVGSPNFFYSVLSFTQMNIVFTAYYQNSAHLLLLCNVFLNHNITEGNPEVRDGIY